MVVDCPPRCLLRANGTRPAQADYARTNRDAESAGLRFHTETVWPVCPWFGWLKQSRRRGHQVGAREPQPQGIRARQLRFNSVIDCAADTLAQTPSPLVPAGTRPTPLPPSDRPLSLSRPTALAASGTRGLPASAAPSVFRLAVRVVSGRRVGRSALVLVERMVDPGILGIGYPLSGALGAHHSVTGDEGFPVGSAVTVSGLCPIVGRAACIRCAQRAAFDVWTSLNRRSAAILPT